MNLAQLLLRLPLLALFLPLVSIAGDAVPAPVPRVEGFSPLGTAKAVRQVAARFSTPMVKLGDPRMREPFVVECPASGSGRWADDRNWVYDFDEDLEAGLRCSFELRSGLADVGGAAVGGTRAFRFETGGPAVRASLPREGWRSIDEEQVFLLRLDAEATPASIEANAYCAVQGIEERIPVRLLPPPERDALLAQREALGYDFLRLLWKNGRQSGVRVPNGNLEADDSRLVALRCQRHLPPETNVMLQWAAGIRTPSGIATAEDQPLAFRVRPAFIARVECTRSNARAGCLPMLPISVDFSAPVPREKAMAVRLRTPAGALLAPRPAESPEAPTLDAVHFAGPFPESTNLSVLLPEGMVDDAGRTLANAGRFPLEIRVDALPSLVRFPGQFGILELAEGGVLPVTLRNVEAMLPAQQVRIDGRVLRLDADPMEVVRWMERVRESERPRGHYEPIPAGEPGQGDEDAPRQRWVEETGTVSVFGAEAATQRLDIRKPLGPKEGEVVGIPLRRPGFYVIEIGSALLGASLLDTARTRYVSTAALVTDMAVHFKWGRERSLVWVTRLSTGEPVADAQVQITDTCTGSTLWSGSTDARGLALAGPGLGQPATYGGCHSTHPLLVLARKGADFSFAGSQWSDGIAPGDFGLPFGYGGDADIRHTVLDRSLFRPDETVSMKHFLRTHTLAGFEVPKSPPKPPVVEIAHEGSGQRYPLVAAFDTAGTAVDSWKIPADAKLGNYRVSIDRRPTARFKVAAFRLPTMRGSITGPPRPLVSPATVDFDLHVAYLSGGGAARLPVKVRTLIEKSPLGFAGYADYSFGGPAVVEGISTGEHEPEETARTRTIPLTLDANGAARLSVDELGSIDGAARLTAELEYLDASGEVMTASGSARLVSSSLVVGLRTESWLGSPGQVRFRVVVLDLDGKPKAGQAVTVGLFQSRRYSYRKRMLGGFYTYESTREVRRLAGRCEGVTDAQGLLPCEVAPGVSGEVLIRAETRDPRGATAGSTASMWVFGADEWWFGGTSGDRMDVLPERREYEAGEVARFQVRMPFRKATALVTVEREGVLKSFIREIDGASPVIEIPVDASMAPNAYVSVLAIRGRVPRPEGTGNGDAVTGLVDLTKPAFRLGMARIAVGWRPHRLDVRVQPDRRVYQAGQRAMVKVQVSAASGAALPAGTEVAIAAVDEALLDLNPNDSWNLLDAMMGTRLLEVTTSTSQMQVVGKRHYGRKAVPQGGGGGREQDRARELFDSLLFWNPRVALDANGQASVDIPLNDSLTAFRIVAVASGGTGLFGTGSTTITSTRDLMLISGLPPLVREGDRFLATFTARNTTERDIAIEVRATTAQLQPSPPPETLNVPAGMAVDLRWPVQVPVGVDHLEWDVSATAAGARLDRLKVSQQVKPAVPVRTYQATLRQLDTPAAIAVERPKQALPGRGGLEVTVQPHLGDSLQGVREFMSRYPYTCLEQLVSRAVALRSRSQWDGVMARLPAYLDADGLARYFPSERIPGDDSLTAYVLAIAQESGYPLDEADRDRMIGALTRFVEGRLARDSALRTADLAYRKLAAIEALSRHGAARADMLDSIRLDPDLMPTSALLDWMGVLQRVAAIPDSPSKLEQASGLLRARLNFQGTTMGFSTERTDALWWLMVSADSNANRMVLAALQRPEWQQDMGRLVRGSLGRQQRGTWNTTVANAWGVLAMEKFSAAYESTPVAGSTAVRYGGAEHHLPWPSRQATQSVSLAWQATPGTLEVSQQGTGSPWMLVRATAALPLSQPLSSGYRITRTITPVEQQVPGQWSRGDVARVRLEIDAQSDMTWVVIDDPVPAGSTVLGSGLMSDSTLLQRGRTNAGVAWLAFEEQAFDAWRAYYRFVPKGRWSNEYTVRFNNPGTFLLPPTRVEAMYAPEMFGEKPNAAVDVRLVAPGR